MEALYSLHVYGQFSCRIPKVSGKGFLKAALGGHHFNEASRVFYDALYDVGLGNRDICDVDGYLSIDQPKSLFGKHREEDAKLLMKALQITFPRITHWTETEFQTMALI